MVSKINLPVHDYFEVLNSVLEGKKRDKRFWAEIDRDLFGQAELYGEFFGCPSRITPLDLSNYEKKLDKIPTRKNSLIGLYSNVKGNLFHKYIYSMRHDHGLNFCPSCGELGVPATLDHYLPKDTYPELSALFINLSPMCDICQKHKGTDYCNDSGGKKFINPYFDGHDDFIVSLNFSPPYSSPYVEFSINDGFCDDKKNLILSHLNGVKFFKRFIKYFPSEYAILLAEARDLRLDGESVLKTFKSFMRRECRVGVNTWRSILYRSVCSDADLMDYLENGEIPDDV